MFKKIIRFIENKIQNFILKNTSLIERINVAINNVSIEKLGIDKKKFNRELFIKAIKSRFFGKS